MDTKLKELYIINQNKKLLNAISLKYPNISSTMKLTVLSILNTLIILFNVKKDDVSKLLDELLLLYSRNVKDDELNKSSVFQKKLFVYLTNAYNDSYPLINELVNSYKNKIINNDMNLYLDNRVLVLSNMYICNNKEAIWNYDNLFNLVNNLYNNNHKNSNLYFSNIKVGSKKGPFASNANYNAIVSLIINVKDFYETGCFYIIDLLNRNLVGESKYKINYNLTNIIKYYDVKRINKNILKISYKNNWNSLSNENKNKLLFLLKLEGNGTLFIENNEVVKKVLTFDEINLIPKKVIEEPKIIEPVITNEEIKQEVVEPINNISVKEEVEENKNVEVNNEVIEEQTPVFENNTITDEVETPKKNNSLLIIDIFIGILIIAIILVVISMFRV